MQRCEIACSGVDAVMQIDEARAEVALFTVMAVTASGVGKEMHQAASLGDGPKMSGRRS